MSVFVVKIKTTNVVKDQQNVIAELKSNFNPVAVYVEKVYKDNVYMYPSIQPLYVNYVIGVFDKTKLSRTDYGRLRRMASFAKTYKGCC